MSLRTYISVYENQRLIRKPPLLGPPLPCAELCYGRVQHGIVYHTASTELPPRDCRGAALRSFSGTTL